MMCYNIELIYTFVTYIKRNAKQISNDITE